MIECLAQYELVVGFVLYDVPDSFQLLLFGQTFQSIVDIRGSQRNPAHDAADQRFQIRHRKQIRRFLKTLPRLHGNKSIDRTRRGNLSQFRE